MKALIKFSIFTLLTLCSSTLHATNGDSMIGQGAKSRAMGGVGIAINFGANSGIANPALIASAKQSEITGAITLFNPDVKYEANDMGAHSSGNELSYIPELAYIRTIGTAAIGIQATCVAGMGVDYNGLHGTSNDNGALNLQTDLRLFKLAIPIAVKLHPNFSLGLAPVLEGGSLQINYVTPAGASDNPVSTSYAMGYEVGAVYGDDTFTFGMVYKSAIDLSYSNNLANAAADFGLVISSGNKLTQPEEYGIGASYKYDRNTFAIDYKYVSLGDADGYSNLGWKDQEVFALGYQYDWDKISLRLGFNYAESPIVEQDGSTYQGAATNFFNLGGFPAIIEHHYTAGFGYRFNRKLEFNGAIVYAPEAKKAYNISAMSEAMGLDTPATAIVRHSQIGFTLALNYKFF